MVPPRVPRSDIVLVSTKETGPESESQYSDWASNLRKTGASHLPALVDSGIAETRAIGTAQGTQIFHHALLPQESTDLRSLSGEGIRYCVREPLHQLVRRLFTAGNRLCSVCRRAFPNRSSDRRSKGRHGSPGTQSADRLHRFVRTQRSILVRLVSNQRCC